MWQSGVTDQFGLNLTAGMFRESTPWSHVFETRYLYSKVRFSGVEQTVADAQYLEYQAVRSLAPRVFLAIRPSFKRNTIQDVDYRFEELIGLGFTVVKTAKVVLTVVPGGGGLQQRKHIPEVDGGSAIVGVYQGTTYTINAAWRFDQSALYLRDLQPARDYRFQADATLKGAITPIRASERLKLMLTVAYLFDHENVVLTAGEQQDQRLSVGIEVSF